MTSTQELRKALEAMKYHKVDIFIHRCKIEEDGENTLQPSTIKDVAYSMLDRDLEEELLLRLGIYN